MQPIPWRKELSPKQRHEIRSPGLHNTCSNLAGRLARCPTTHSPDSTSTAGRTPACLALLGHPMREVPQSHRLPQLGAFGLRRVPRSSPSTSQPPRRRIVPTPHRLRLSLCLLFASPLACNLNGNMLWNLAGPQAPADIVRTYAAPAPDDSS